jgi:prophage maintenance system killer protein
MKDKRILIYNSEKGKIQLDITLENETIWMSQKQIADLFDTDRTSITRHINNVFRTGELKEKTNAKTVKVEGSDRPVKYYSLDTILSVGYRVNSRKATKFRIWATNTLSNYLVQGYVLDERRLLQNYKTQLKELKQMVDFIASKGKIALPDGEGKDILNFIHQYAKSIDILEEYDAGEFELLDYNIPKFKFSYKNSLQIIENLKEEVVRKNPYNNLFGTDVDQTLESIIKTINQTYDEKDLYPSVEEKASNLLYLIIKDHPFLDGNKRIATILFIYYLRENDFLYDQKGKERFNESTLVTLSVLIASSNPKEKELMVKLIMRLIQS